VTCSGTEKSRASSGSDRPCGCPYRKPRLTVPREPANHDCSERPCGLIWCATAGLLVSRIAWQAEVLIVRRTSMCYGMSRQGNQMFPERVACDD
jgi:hypothetical protein